MFQLMQLPTHRLCFSKIKNGLPGASLFGLSGKKTVKQASTKRAILTAMQIIGNTRTHTWTFYGTLGKPQ